MIDSLPRIADLQDATDLPALAAAHSQFQALRERMDVDPPKASETVAMTESATKLVERIILNEVDDAEASLKALCQTVSLIQSLLSGSGPDAPPMPVEPGTPASAPAAEVSTASETKARSATPQIAQEEGPFSADDQPLIREFINESTEHLQAAEAEILKLEDNVSDNEAIHGIFRSFHTIKGVAGFLNLKQIAGLAHAAENLLDLARRAQLVLTQPAVDVILQSLDAMKHLVVELSKALDEGASLPAQAGLDALLRKLHDCAAGKAPQPQTATAAAPTPEASTPTPAKEPTTSTATHGAASTSHGSSNADATVKVATERLDSLINMVGELVIAQAMVKQDSAIVAAGNHRLSRNMSQLGKITRELQELSMSMRMVPIHGVFQKMTRLVRDLSRKFCKEIDLVTTGGDTELDRNVVEAISDPLVHMVRNAIDHGIESPEQRVASGKPREGKLTLRACHRAGNVVIEIADDGKGLPKEKILKKAREAGIVGETEELTESEIFKLIFHAGLSTAEKVTDVSGRGVGMDVVRKNVEALRGRIDITSAPGQGSTFTVRLPLTLAVIDGLIVNVGTHRYIIPLTSVDQSMRPKPEQMSTVQQRGEMVMVRGRLLPLVRLYSLFGCEPKSHDPTQALVVIVQDNERSCCLLVDELLGQQQVVIKSLGESLGAVKGISGGAILGDGNVSLILDVPGLIDLASH